MLQRRFGGARPGLQLIAVEEAAIPVTVLRADVLAQEKKQLPITEEFTLRFIEHGVDRPDEIAAFLGLEPVHVLEAAAAHLQEGNLRRFGDGERLALTSAGTEVVRDHAAVQPVLRQLPVTFDRLTWSLVSYHERHLIEKKEAIERGMLVIPAVRNARIGLADVTPAGFNSLLKDDKVQVLRVHKVAVKKHRYLPAQLLIYGDEKRGEIELAVMIDDDLANEHILALERIEAVKQLKLTIGDSQPRPVLDADLESQRVSIPTTPEIEGQAEVQPQTSGTSLVRSVSVFEHADLLAEALRNARKRLLIISPWVKNAVVNTDFMARLEQRLRVGATVTIAHGYGDDDSGSDPAALRRLLNLANRYETFSVVRLKNTHAKILIFDDQWVSTSFNWLSFRGDPDRTYRMEEGTLVKISERVEREYERYLKLIEEQRS